MNIYAIPFGTTARGEAAQLYTLVNDGGMRVEITDFGGTIVSILAADRNGQFTDVNLGYHTLADYENADAYLGTLVGRVANRIAGASFELDGVVYDNLLVNDGPNHLHGGRYGFSKRVWNSETAVDEAGAHLILTLHSPDGEEGYPGNLDVQVTYTLTSDNALAIHYEATTDKATPLNLTNHAYFNLAGTASGPIYNQTLWLDAESYGASDAKLIPTGELIPVGGTPFDFRTEKPIGRDFFGNNPDIIRAGGYDHCFNFTNWKNACSGGEVVLRGIASDPVSGRTMEMYTNKPCVQLYTANFLKNPRFPLRGGYRQTTRLAFCLETQYMPDSIHHQGDENYTDCVLRPGDKYDYTTIYKFTVR